MRLLALLLLLAAPARAGTLAEVKARGRLIASVKNEGPKSPSLHKDPAHFQKRGFEIALAHALAKALVGDESKLELKLMPKTLRLPAVASGAVDVVLSMIAVNEARKQEVDFSRPYYVNGLGLLVKEGAPIHALADLQGKRVVAAKQTMNDPGAELVALAREQGIAVTLDKLPTFAAAADAVLAGKAAAMVSLEINFHPFIDTQPAGRFTIVPAARREYAVAVQRGNTTLLAAINEALDGLKRSGELAKLIAAAGL